jgi:hypothetical protein
MFMLWLYVCGIYAWIVEFMHKFVGVYASYVADRCFMYLR